MNLSQIYQILYKAYRTQGWWPAKTPYEVMVGAVLTQNTNWGNVEKAIDNFRGRLSPEYIDSLDLNELAQIIRPSGFFNIKAKRIKALNSWFSDYNYSIKTASAENTVKLRAELLNVNGIGRETADSILLYALGKPVFVVDAYTRRIFSRLGFDLPKEYDSIKAFFEETVKPDTKVYNEYHALIVRHAKAYCRKKPDCADCPLSGFCLKIGIDNI